MQRQNNLPSKKFVIFFIFILIGFLIFAFRNKLFPKTQYTEEQKIFLNTKITDYAVTDTDGDGLYDWEEALWATDPKKVDTDGDGVNDKDYVQKRREALGISNYEDSLIDLTETERVSMEFFTIVSSLEQKGLLNSDAVKSVGEMFSQEISGPVEIDESSIKTDFDTVSNNEGSRINYEAQMRIILNKAQKDLIGKEMEYFAKFISQPSIQNKKTIENISNGYNLMSSSLRAVEVPEEIAETHKKLILNSAKLSLAVNFLTYYENDPVLTAKGFVLYKDVSLLFEKNIYTLSAYFQKNQ